MGLTTQRWMPPTAHAARSWFLVMAGLISVGCIVQERERPVYVERQQPVYVQRRPAREVVVEQPSREVVVEQPVEQPVEPVEQVVYEPAPQEVVVVYERDLGPHGHWVQTRYGRCWVWENRPAHWRPYTVGHWVSTEEGWLWVSEGEELAWGPTCYHYGRWYEDTSYGWIWVPGRVWAPSWCAWREGGGHTCWAPLPPECGDGHVISAVVVDRYVPREHFTVVETRNVTNVHIHEHVVINNITIINKTTNITNITYVNNRAVNRGVSVTKVEQASGHHVERQQVTKVNTIAEADRLRAAGKPIMYAPAVVENYAQAHPIVKKTPPPHREPAHFTPTGRDHPAHVIETPAKKPIVQDHTPITSEPKVITGQPKTHVPEEHKATVTDEPKRHPADEPKTKAPVHNNPVTNEPKVTTGQPKAHAAEEHPPIVTEEPKRHPPGQPKAHAAEEHKPIVTDEPKRHPAGEPKAKVQEHPGDPKAHANPEPKANPQEHKTPGSNDPKAHVNDDPKNPKNPRKPKPPQDPNNPTQ